MNSESSYNAITLLLKEHVSRGARSVDHLVPHVYGELRSIAHAYLLRERQADTLSTTALVHEAYLKLVNQTEVSARGRTYFFGAAARAMRQILVDHARRRNSLKRGGDQKRAELDSIHLAVDDFAAELLDLDEALQQLAVSYPRQADVVEFRFFGGMSIEEIATALGLSASTVKQDWALARAWLYRHLNAA